jgi:hypothetical protein
MKILYKNKTLPDGRVLQYHNINQLIFNNTSIIVELNSYNNMEELLLNLPADAKFDVVLPISISNNPDYLENIESYIGQIPEWADTTIDFDSSKPVITEIPNRPQNAEVPIPVNIPASLLE